MDAYPWGDSSSSLGNRARQRVGAPGKGERPFNEEGATFPSRTIMRPPWQNNQKPRPDNVGRGTRGLDGDRTHDLLFRRQTLYPLSYKPE